MDIPDRHPGSGDTPFTGTSTGRVQVGRFILDVPAPGGTTLSWAPRRARTEPPPALTTALAQETPHAPAGRDLVETANQVLDTAEAVTDQVEHVTDTVQAILAGRIPDPELISGDLVEWLELMQRLARSGRFAEVIKLGRPVCRLLALTLRWAALVESLRLIFHAATALADTPATAWTEHELGTLHGSVGHADRARELLRHARRTREEIGDEDGLRATDHNLKLLSGRAAITRSTAALAGVGVVVLIVAVLVFAETVDGGSSPGSAASTGTSSTIRSSGTASTRDASTTSRSTSVQVDSSGTAGTAPSAVPRPRAITFAATTIGQGAQMEVDLANNGPGPLTVTSAQIGDGSEFTITSDTCGGHVVSAGALCTVTVDFTPTTAGAASAMLTFTDDAEPSTQQVPLAATGQPRATSSTGTTTPTNPSSGTGTQPSLVQ
jgi:Abnormal spindle-like microcephaly-assoc'd, ASPM-SPD-2-Hydin